MVDTSQILRDIEAHNDICCQLLVVIQQENQWLSQDHTTDVSSPDQAVKRTLLEQLSRQVSLIQGHRVALKDHERVHPEDPIPKEVYSAIGRGTDLIMMHKLLISISFGLRLHITYDAFHWASRVGFHYGKIQIAFLHL